MEARMTRTARRIYSRACKESTSKMTDAILANKEVQWKAFCDSMRCMPLGIRLKTAWKIIMRKF